MDLIPSYVFTGIYLGDITFLRLILSVDKNVLSNKVVIRLKKMHVKAFGPQ